MNLKNQKRLASDILKTGRHRVWIDPDRVEDVEDAFTREDVRRLIREGTIKKVPAKGGSKGRTRLLHAKKKSGRRRGAGSRKGTKTARQGELWKNRIRRIRAHLKYLRDRRIIQRNVYRQLYRLAKGGVFQDINRVERYIEDHQLRRRR